MRFFESKPSAFTASLRSNHKAVKIIHNTVRSGRIPWQYDGIGQVLCRLAEHFCLRNALALLRMVRGTYIDTQKPQRRDGVILCSKGWLGALVEGTVGEGVTPCDAETWMNSQYEPLPTIVEAARAFMKHKEPPNIRRVNSTVIPQAIARLTELAQDATVNKRHMLALVTGVPGAGKTHLGLQYVYDICESNEHVNSVYLSGNGPLVKVLQDALQSKVFVRDVHTVANEFLGGRMGSFEKNIVVFDEGQRAWGIGQMQRARRSTGVKILALPNGTPLCARRKKSGASFAPTS